MTAIARPAPPGLIDPARDDAAHDGVAWEIWWTSALVEAAGRRLAAHALLTHLADGGLAIAASLTDIDRETVLAAAERRLPPGAATLSRETLAIAAGEVALSGSFADGYRLRADLDDGCGFDLALTPSVPVLLNAGTGRYRIADAETVQYSVGNLRAAGTVRIAGESAVAHGRGWHDRQWEEAVRARPLAFTWFGLCIGEEVLSVFEPDGDEPGWATIVQADGTHIVAAARIAPGDHAVTARGRGIARRWTVTMPALDARLAIATVTLADGRLIYTAAAEVTGTYRGGSTAGFGFCDMVGAIA